MEEKRKSLVSKYRVVTSTILGLIEISYIGSIGVVLVTSEGDCNTPLRLWLEVLLLIFSLHFLMFSVSEIIMPYCSKFLSGKMCVVSASFNAFLGLFMSVWFILGNFWYYNADSLCESAFYEGHTAVYFILIIYYMFLGSACCFGSLILILISLGAGITNRTADY